MIWWRSLKKCGPSICPSHQLWLCHEKVASVSGASPKGAFGRPFASSPVTAAAADGDVDCDADDTDGDDDDDDD